MAHNAEKWPSAPPDAKQLPAAAQNSSFIQLVREVGSSPGGGTKTSSKLGVESCHWLRNALRIIDARRHNLLPTLDHCCYGLWDGRGATCSCEDFEQLSPPLQQLGGGGYRLNRPSCQRQLRLLWNGSNSARSVTCEERNVVTHDWEEDEGRFEDRGRQPREKWEWWQRRGQEELQI